MSEILSRYIFILTIVLGLVVLSGCEGYSCANGTVYDSETKEPLDSVLCIVLTGSEKQYTDSVGNFSVCNDFGSCVPDCPDIKVEFLKNGYKTTKGININGDKVFLEKE